MQQKEILKINGHEVPYVLTYKKVKNVNIRVKADGTVAVSAPQRVSRELIESILTSRADFILNALAKYAALEQTAPRVCHYRSGIPYGFWEPLIS